jgi:hypothetical protein
MMPTRPVSAAARRILPLAAVILAVIALEIAGLRRPSETPTLVSTLRSYPEAIQYDGGAWYWIEHTKDAGMKLMRADRVGTRVIAEALARDHYVVKDGTVAWVTRQEHAWSVQIQGSGQAVPRVLWSGPDEPKGLALGEGRALWLRRVPPAVLGASPLAPLSASLEIMAAPLPDGAAVPLARLWEPDDGEVLGEQGGVLVVAAYRRAPPGSLSLYRILAPGTPPVRVAAETGNPPALLTRSGELFWLAASREGTSSYCLRRLAANDRAETVTDWLPIGGTLHETERGVMYADRATTSGIWPITRPDAFPEPLPLPEGYEALAAGGGEMLLASLTPRSLGVVIYRMRLP